jgi:hypothetical protein
MLQQQGIGFGTPQGAIGVAHHVCDTLGGGMEPSDISSNIAAANSRIDRRIDTVDVYFDPTVDAREAVAAAGSILPADRTHVGVAHAVNWPAPRSGP